LSEPLNRNKLVHAQRRRKQIESGGARFPPRSIKSSAKR